MTWEEAVEEAKRIGELRRLGRFDEAERKQLKLDKEIEKFERSSKKWLSFLFTKPARKITSFRVWLVHYSFFAFVVCFHQAAINFGLNITKEED